MSLSRTNANKISALMQSLFRGRREDYYLESHCVPGSLNMQISVEGFIAYLFADVKMEEKEIMGQS